jgi:hypothetical protein
MQPQGKKVGRLTNPGDDSLRQLARGHGYFSHPIGNCLSLIELSFRVIEKMVDPFAPGVTELAEEAVNELNTRFRQHAIGYQYVAGEIVRVDSDYLHAGVLVPSIMLLRDGRFGGAAEEFLKGHEHYRRGRNKEAITEVLKAFESTMRTIADRRNWSYKPGAAGQRSHQRHVP